MTGRTALRLPESWRQGDGVAIARDLRLMTGLTMFSFVLSHLVGHALALVSLDVADTYRHAVMSGGWTTLPGTVVLVMAISLHVTLGLGRLLRRRLRFTDWQALQVALGLMIPLLLMEHVVGTLVARHLYEVNPTYPYVVLSLLLSPASAVAQGALLLVAWGHGCMGVHYAFRFRRWYRNVRGMLAVVALLLPTLAGSGFITLLREMALLQKDEAWRREALAAMNLPNRAELEHLTMLRDYGFAGFAGLIIAIMMARGLRSIWQRRRGQIRIQYASGRQLRTSTGPTLLEISQEFSIPHAAVCGGRGRCSTCRVRLGRGGHLLPPPEPEEAKVLRNVAAPPTVRLACQIRPTSDLEVTPLVSVGAGEERALEWDPRTHGREIPIAVLFADLRGFTALSEHRLPYDTVFLLNRYFAEMGEAIRGAGGHVDKFMGDGVMALFGLHGDIDRGCVQALRAAEAMRKRLTWLNQMWEDEIPKPLRLGIGIHAGPAIVGDMGWGQATQLTAVGDTVNTAARLEQMTKERQAELIVSREVTKRAGIDCSHLPSFSVPIRGRSGEIDVVQVDDIGGWLTANPEQVG